VLLVLTPVFSWIWTVMMARDMYGPMSGASAWMMTTHWDAPHLLLLWAMWAVMMTAMMQPSAAPLILLYGAAARRSGQRTARRNTYALAAGYLVAWTMFSLAAGRYRRPRAMF
jgi:predicted metal-binding membrane protein